MIYPSKIDLKMYLSGFVSERSCFFKVRVENQILIYYEDYNLFIVYDDFSLGKRERSDYRRIAE